MALAGACPWWVRCAHAAARRRLPVHRPAPHAAHADPRARDALGELVVALGPARRREPCPAPRRRGGGGRALLRPPRRRLGRPPARARIQRALARPAAPRRGHHHHAVRAHGLPVAGTELRAEGARGLLRVPARAHVGEAAYSRGVRQHRRVGRSRLRRGGRRAALLRPARGAGGCVAVRAARRRAAESAAMEPGRADAVPPGARSDHRGAGGARPARDRITPSSARRGTAPSRSPCARTPRWPAPVETSRPWDGFRSPPRTAACPPSPSRGRWAIPAATAGAR